MYISLLRMCGFKLKGNGSFWAWSEYMHHGTCTSIIMCVYSRAAILKKGFILEDTPTGGITLYAEKCVLSGISGC